MPNIKVTNEAIEVSTGGDPAEVLRVKRLPGRAYDGEREVWTVPVLPGLARALEEEYGDLGAQIAILIEDEEKKFLASLEVAGPVDPFKIGAVEACNLAMTHHLYAVHGGDRGEYSKVHWPFIFGE